MLDKINELETIMLGDEKSNPKFAWLKSKFDALRSDAARFKRTEKENVTHWEVERKEAVAQLREVCEAFGDNEWDESLHLADVVEKHLARYLFSDEQ